MRKYVNGMRAGFVATGILSVLMLAKGPLGIMPDFDVIALLSAMLGRPDAFLVGWIAHFAIGTVLWGVLFVMLLPYLPGSSYVLKGVVFGVAAWTAMMAAVMPMAKAGPFGLNFGLMAPAMMLMLHLVFGAALGAAYGMRADRLMFANMK